MLAEPPNATNRNSWPGRCFCRQRHDFHLSFFRFSFFISLRTIL